MTTPYSPEDVRKYREIVKDMDTAKRHFMSRTYDRLWWELEQLKNDRFNGKAPEPEGK